MIRRCVDMLLVTALCVLLTACPAKRADHGNAELGTPPRADLSGPDTALHSYWALLDWYQRRLEYKGGAGGPPPKLVELMSVVCSGDVLASFDKYTPRTLQLERTVETISREGPDRALVVAHIRSSAGALPGLTPTPIELFARETGGEYRYVMNREADGWKVAQVWRLDESSGPRRIR